MEKLTIEIPIKLGDKLYRTDLKCDIQEGTVIHISVYGEINKNTYDKSAVYPDIKDNLKVQFTVHFSYGCDVVYTSDELGVNIFKSKMEVVKRLIGEVE